MRDVAWVWLCMEKRNRYEKRGWKREIKKERKLVTSWSARDINVVVISGNTRVDAANIGGAVDGKKNGKGKKTKEKKMKERRKIGGKKGCEWRRENRRKERK